MTFCYKKMTECACGNKFQSEATIQGTYGSSEEGNKQIKETAALAINKASQCNHIKFRGTK